jgi:signal peptidase II
VARADGWKRALIVAAAVVLVDQVTKAAVVANVALGSDDPIFPGISLTYVRNSGVAFGALAGGGAIVWVLTLAALGGLLAYFAAHAGKRMLWLPVGIIAGGAIGNLADRARVGYVIDFIDPVLWPAFNVADICIVVGILGLFYVMEGEARSKPSP